MNFLAHLYLSGNDEGVMLGNFMADFVKGRPENRLPASDQRKEILRGIWLHRHIDYFTDTHDVVRQSKQRLHPGYHKYAGVITDMFYDHLLAAHWSEYSSIPLADFASQVYAILKRNQHVFPAGMERVLHEMVTQNWLVSYAQLDGIERALQGMARRTTFNSGMERAVTDLRQHYALFHQEFKVFFPQLIHAAQVHLQQYQT
ncbi:MAG: ACP phosphodiesterase [Bacteroidota bacterium]